jgi:hypothetical protein
LEANARRQGIKLKGAGLPLSVPLAAANQALVELKTRKIRGAKVLLMA